MYFSCSDERLFASPQSSTDTVEQKHNFCENITNAVAIQSSQPLPFSCLYGIC